jgi:glycosyltransferase involved in cell wall biosynthesis
MAGLGIGVPHIATSHDVIRPEAHFPGIVGKCKRALLGATLSRVDRLIVVTHDARENHLECLPSLKRQERRIDTIVHGIDSEHFNQGCGVRSHELRARLGIPREAYLIGYLGRFMEQKGFMVLVDAFDRLLRSRESGRQVHLLAVGSGDMLENYRHDIDKRGLLRNHISFVEHVSDVLPVFAEIDLLVMPSLWEACGLLAMEAMCAGVPVLGTDCIGLREVLQDSPSRSVAPGDPEALSLALQSAVSNPWTLEALQYAPEACDRFDVTNAATKLLAAYRDLVGSGDAVQIC